MYRASDIDTILSQTAVNTVARLRCQYDWTGIAGHEEIRRVIQSELVAKQ